ncbi:hypothetical protein CAF53_01550 [Sphingobium sp. LB126]|nr:hypothetical protein CAF53_01550 [Sphingobium sp. LB126]
MGDLLFALSEWLRSTALVEGALWLADTPISVFVRDHFYVIPVLQTIHILSIAVAFGSAMMVNGHILGIGRIYPTLDDAVRRFTPWMWIALALLIVSGLGLVISDPPRELLNAVFWMKIILVVGIVLLSVGFQQAAGVARRQKSGSARSDGGAGLRAGAIGISLLWCATMIAGRWIYYAPV